MCGTTTLNARDERNAYTNWEADEACLGKWELGETKCERQVAGRF